MPNCLQAEAPDWFFKVLEYVVNPFVAYALVIVLLVVIGFQVVILRNVRGQAVNEIFSNGVQLRDLIQTQREKQELERQSKREQSNFSRTQDKFVKGVARAAVELGYAKEGQEKKNLTNIARHICFYGELLSMVMFGETITLLVCRWLHKRCTKCCQGCKCNRCGEETIVVAIENPQGF